MKVKEKIVLIIFALFLLSFTFYLYKLHSLAVEGNDIYAFRCTKVNPPLIAYKNSFLSFADAMKNPTKYKDEEVRKFFYDYIAEMRKYVPEETSWLEENGKYMSRWDFQLIEPWYIKQAGDYQQKMYEGYHDDAKYMLEVYDNGDTDEDLTSKFNDARGRINKYSRLYFDFSDKAMAINDWRKIFGNVPLPPECTDNVLRIPNTAGALDPDPIPVKNPDITG